MGEPQVELERVWKDKKRSEEKVASLQLQQQQQLDAAVAAALVVAAETTALQLRHTDAANAVAAEKAALQLQLTDAATQLDNLQLQLTLEQVRIWDVTATHCMYCNTLQPSCRRPWAGADEGCHCRCNTLQRTESAATNCSYNMHASMRVNAGMSHS